MNVVFTLVRKHLVEAKWMLGLSAAALCGLTILTTWLTSLTERQMDSGEMARNPRRFGVLRFLGGPEMDFSTTALEVCFWNHPVVVLTVLSWAVSRGSWAVAGEIERGTVDVTLSRPVSRSSYLTSQILATTLGLMALAFGLIAGCELGSLFFTLKAPPSFWTLLKPATMVVTLGMAVYGYTLPFSALDVVRWRPTLAGAGITLTGLIAMTVSRQYEGYEWLDNLSVFNLYAPVTVAMKGAPLAYNASVLLGVFATGAAASYWLFSRRDLPSNS
jgi:ABC-2 type transport system permease protein